DALCALTDEMVESTKSEPGALIYERYISPDRQVVHVFERYVDADAAVAHLTAFGRMYGERFGRMVDRKRFTVFGTPSPALRAILDPLGATYAEGLAGFSRERPVPVETLKAIANAFNAHDLDAIMAFFAEDCSLDMPRGPDPWGRRYTGKAAVREGLAARFKGLPDVHYGEDRHWVSGNLGVSEWLLTGTTPDGVKIRVRGCDHWEFRDGKVTRKDSYWKIVERAAS
ncbi:MAG TPA: nuclear transport factor 2 family protein, partial [Burkholderiales bacterium]|nr:nuclear transport factor 2 family protein [Burkholderiales bacterium]